MVPVRSIAPAIGDFGRLDRRVGVELRSRFQQTVLRGYERLQIFAHTACRRIDFDSAGADLVPDLVRASRCEPRGDTADRLLRGDDSSRTRRDRIIAQRDRTREITDCQLFLRGIERHRLAGSDQISARADSSIGAIWRAHRNLVIIQNRQMAKDRVAAGSVAASGERNHTAKALSIFRKVIGFSRL